MTRRPAINMWKLPAVLAKPIRRAATATRMLFRRSPPFLPSLPDTNPTSEPPIIPPMQKIATVQAPMSSASESHCSRLTVTSPSVELAQIFPFTQLVMIFCGALRTPVL